MNENSKESIKVSEVTEEATPETWGELTTTWGQESKKDSTWS